MKTTFILAILTFLTVFNTHSQEKDFDFNRLNTRKLTIKGLSASEIYSVSYAAVEQSVNPEYTKLISELENVIADSLSKRADYDKAVDRFNDIRMIKNKIIEFNNSDKYFATKVTLLKDAQILASKHNIKDLFYSDNEINKEMKAGFLVLTFNLEDLKTHLNTILLKLDTKFKAPELPTYVSTLALREKIYHTTKKQAK